MEAHQSDTSAHPAAFSTRRIVDLSKFAKRATFKRASSYVERDAIFRLRYRSYLGAGTISPNPFGRHIETADNAADAYLVGLHVDRRLVSSLRLQVGNESAAYFSSLELFPQVLEPLLSSDKTIVEMTRPAADGDLGRRYVWMPYLILRAWIMAAEHFHADYLTAVVRPQHQLFYQRLLASELHSGGQPLLHRPTGLGLVILDFASSARRLFENLPFLRSMPSEREQLFDSGATPPKVTASHTLLS